MRVPTSAGSPLPSNGGEWCLSPRPSVASPTTARMACCHHSTVFQFLVPSGARKSRHYTFLTLFTCPSGADGVMDAASLNPTGKDGMSSAE